MQVGVLLTIKKLSKDGKVLFEQRKQSESLVQAFINGIRMFMVTGIGDSLPDTSGTSRTVYRDTDDFWVNAPAGDSNYGVVVGTDPTAVDLTQYALLAQLTEGTGVGNISHQATTVTSPVYTATKCSFHIQRSFINNTGALITVRETGLYGILVSGGVNYPYMFARDVITAIDLADGETLFVDYEFEISV